MAYNLGSAYIQIVPTAKGMGRGIEKELAGVGARAGSSRGSGMGGKLWGGLKAGAVGAGVAIGGVLAGSVTKGFSRMRNIENAEAKLTGLGHSAAEVEVIMGSALKSVEGTAYGLDTAAGLAATMVASGIKPGKELESTLSLVADSATISGRSMEDMGLIWAQVASKGKLQGDDALQVMEAGIPIWQLIGDEMGVTAAKAQEMSQKGEVSFETFRSAMETGMGGAALASGKTVTGAFNNMGAAMGRFGAALLEDVYPHIAPTLGKITELFDYLTNAAGPAIDRVVGGFRDWVASDGVQTMLGTLRDVGAELYERVLKPLGTWIAENWKPIAAVVGGIFAAFAGGALIAAVGAVGAAIGGVFTVAGLVTAAIGAAVGALTWFFTSTETGKKMLDGFVGFVRDTLVPGIVGGFTLVRDFVVYQLWPMIKSRFEAIKALAIQVWQGVIQPAFEQFAAFIRDTVMPIVQRLWSEYIQPVFLAIGALAVWLWNNAIKPAMSAIDGFIRNTLGPIIVWLWKNVVSPVFTAIGNFIGWVWNNVIFPALDALKYFLTKVLAPAFVWLWNTVNNVWNWIRKAVAAVVGWFQTWVVPVIQVVVSLIRVAFNNMRNWISQAWSWVRNRVIAPFVAWFRDTVWPIIQRVIGFIRDRFNWMRDRIREAWNAIRDNIIKPVVNWFRDTVKPIFDDATGGIGDAFNKLKDVVKTAWEAIKNAAKAPVRFVVNTVINDALIGNFNTLAGKLGTKKLPKVSLPKGFARGGVLPGMSSMRDGDDQLVPMRRGEGVLVSEGLRTAKDRAAFMAANAAGRRGVGFASLMGGGFAGGGILDDVKSLGGDAWDALTGAADWAGKALTDPKKAFQSLIDSVIGKVPGSGLLRDAAIAIPKRIANDIASKLTSSLGDMGGGGGGGSVPQGGASGTGWARASGAASALGLTMTSGFRRGARTAGSGSRSLHSMGRARDYAGSPGQMRAFFNAMDAAPYPTELLYSPMGGRNIHRGGRRYPNTGATKRNHYNHVHVGFRQGGIFDQGGLMQPGMTGINLTRKPEAVLDPRMTKAYVATAEAFANGAGMGGVQIGTVQGYSAEEVAEKIEKKRRQRELLYAR